MDCKWNAPGRVLPWHFPVLSLPVWAGVEVERPMLRGSLRGMYSHAHLLV